MFNMGSHHTFGYLKHNLWMKEKVGVKLPIWLPTTKSQESPWFTYVQVLCHIPLRSSQWGLQLCFRPHFNWRFTKKNTGLQNYGNMNFENFLGQNDIWVLPMARLKEYYKGEGGGFPQVWVTVSLMNPCLFVVCLCTKSVSIMH
jgi:hypothetical protein